MQAEIGYRLHSHHGHTLNSCKAAQDIAENTKMRLAEIMADQNRCMKNQKCQTRQNIRGCQNKSTQSVEGGRQNYLGQKWISVRLRCFQHFPFLLLFVVNNSIINKQELVLLRPQVVNPLLHQLLHKRGQDLDDSAIETDSTIANGCIMQTNALARMRSACLQQTVCANAPSQTP